MCIRDRFQSAHPDFEATQASTRAVLNPLLDEMLKRTNNNYCQSIFYFFTKSDDTS